MAGVKPNKPNGDCYCSWIPCKHLVYDPDCEYRACPLCAIDEVYCSSCDDYQPGECHFCEGDSEGVGAYRYADGTWCACDGRFPSESELAVTYCPWCGKKLE